MLECKKRKHCVHVKSLRLVRSLAREDVEVQVLDELPVRAHIDGGLTLVLKALIAVEHAPARGLAATAASIEAALLSTPLLALATPASLLLLLLTSLLTAEASAALAEATARVEVLGLRRGAIVDHGEGGVIFDMEVVEDSIDLLLLGVAL